MLKFKKIKILIIVAILLSGFATVLSAPNKAYAQTTCKDNSPVPDGVQKGGNPAIFEYCKDHDGFASGDKSRCDDGTKVEDGTIAAGSEQSFCNSHLGYSGSGSGESTPSEQPKFTKSDCQGSNIKANAGKDSPDHCGILDYLVVFVKFLSVVVGVVVLIGVIIGGIQYSASNGDPGAVTAAKKRIFNAILALVIYVFIFAILQFLIPGGVVGA